MKKYFFEPRVGSRYAEKWDGYYTMILGAHQVCTANCEFKSLCTTNAGVREMDNACPVYEEGRDDYERIDYCFINGGFAIKQWKSD